MLRVRFRTTSDDYRPVNWPIKHPYWCTGHGDGYSIVVAYADDEPEIMHNWPEAYDLDISQVDHYQFSDRFPKPDWFEEPTND